MNLTPREKDKLMVSLAAMVARGRLARGVKLNHPEAVALITDFVVEGAREGRSVADLMQAGAEVIGQEQCMARRARDDPYRCRSRRPFPTAPSLSPFTIPSVERHLR